MGDKLDQSLEEITRQSRGRGRRGGFRPTNGFNQSFRGRGGSGVYGPMRRGRGGPRPNPYPRPAANGNQYVSGTKVFITNLDIGLTAADVREIFQKIGKVLQSRINYDNQGNSLGTAEVSFAQRADAQKAVEEYDGAEVDGKPMYLKLVGATVQGQAERGRGAGYRGSGRGSFRGASRGRGGYVGGGFAGGFGGGGYPGGYPTAGGAPRGRGSFRSRSRGTRGTGLRGGRGRGRARGSRSEKPAAPSAAELDAEMEAYHQKGGDGSADGFDATADDGQPKPFNRPSRPATAKADK